MSLGKDSIQKRVAAAAAARLVADLLTREKIELGGEILTGLNITNGTKGLVHSSTKTSELAPGVTYYEQLYYNKSKAPVRVYSVVIKKGAASIETTMPQDSIESMGKVSNIKNQLSAAVLFDCKHKIIFGGCPDISSE